MRIIRYLGFLFFLVSLTAQAQDLLPFTENFTKSDYNGDNQVWSITQGRDNAFYFANNHYFLRYNGVKWEKYTLPDKTIIRSVMADGEKVYCGSYKEFGYWVRKSGRMVYQSVSAGKNLFTGPSENEEVWKIFRYGKFICFQAFNEMYLWDGSKITKIRFPSLVSYCYVIHGRVYAATVTNGIYVMEGRSFRRMQQWPQLKDNVVHGMEAAADGSVYIFTKNNGVFTGNNTALYAWEHEVNAELKANAILSARFISPGKLAVGTALNGIYIIDTKNNSHIRINRGNALRNNAVLAIGLDKENDLWLGLDNGIAHIEVTSPISLFTDNPGVLGSVYALAALQNGYLLGTNHGLFNYSGKTLSVVQGSQGQVWDISPRGGEYIIGHNDGTFSYGANGYTKYNGVAGGWNFIDSRFDNVYFQANYSGIAVYYDKADLSKYKILGNLTKPVRYIAQNHPGELWAADNYRGLYRIRYDDAFKVTSVENISQKNGIRRDFGVKLFTFNNEVLFFIDQQWYHYNAINGKLEADPLFAAQFARVTDIIPVDGDRFLVVKHGLLYLITRKDNLFEWDLIPEKYYQGRLLPDYTRCFANGNRLYLNLDDGFLCFEPKSRLKKSDVAIEAYLNGKMIAPNEQVKYNVPVEVNFIPQFYGYSRPELFYSATGKRVARAGSGRVTLTNLESGRNEVIVYTGNGDRLQEAARFRFYVARPWYFSWWMISIYFAVTAFIFFLYYKWNKMRYLERIRLNEEELKHRQQIMELEMEADNKLMQQEFEKHILEMEVQAKASEVAGKSLSIAKHSEMIEGIQEVLENETSAEQMRQKIKKIIKVSTLSKNEWQSFEKNLVKSHDEFVQRLTARFPSLTPKDIKLCIYLKMNLSSKEIAPLMNISFRGVELHRYRLRKKLELPSDTNLARFMISI